MQVVLVINESYEAQFMQNKVYLENKLQNIESGTAKMLCEEDFWASTARVLEKILMRISHFQAFTDRLNRQLEHIAKDNKTAAIKFRDDRGIRLYEVSKKSN